jgi:hypothetical protein
VETELYRFTLEQDQLIEYLYDRTIAQAGSRSIITVEGDKFTITESGTMNIERLVEDFYDEVECEFEEELYRRDSRKSSDLYRRERPRDYGIEEITLSSWNYNNDTLTLTFKIIYEVTERELVKVCETCGK